MVEGEHPVERDAESKDPCREAAHFDTSTTLKTREPPAA
jgi:hypothetical protein